ncbi:MULTISPECIES: DUF3352 domain-containing protein [Aphanothece]|uniref:DUF3352 domain-containing protein n=1 Tax=Aphanothece TaxID=1121 RepID=UPI00398486AB
MKARRFVAVVLAATLLLLGLALGGWWLVWQRSPLQLQHQGLILPRSARFVPRQAALSLFLLTDAEEPVRYARAVAPTRQRRQAADAVARLRDGAFAAAGLDYRDELAGWLGPETGLALFAADGAGEPRGWLLALQSRDGDGARRFLQRFWQTRSLAGTGLQVSSYRGMGLISGRAALVGQEPVPVATALIDDDLVLLASGRGVLEQALDVSQIDELNQAADPPFRQALARLEQGAVLLTLRPSGLEPWLGFPGGAPGGLRSLVASLRPQGRQLAVEALIQSIQSDAIPPGEEASTAADDPSGPWTPRLDPSEAEALLDGLRGEVVRLALLQDPAHWPDAWRPLLEQALLGQGGGLPTLVASLDAGPLLWSEGPLGWLLGTRADQPAPAALQPALEDLGLVASTLAAPAAGQGLQVWTHLEATSASRRRGDATSQLEVSLAGARAADGERAWWGQTLAVLEERRSAGSGPRPLRRALDELGLPEAPLQWAVAADPARALLRSWSSWRLLSALAGQPLAEDVEGLALALEPDAGGLHLQARIHYG